MHEPAAPHPWRLLLLTGALGAGKTAVAVEVGELLAARDVPCSVVDLDQLCWTTPAPWTTVTVDDVLVGSLRAMLPVHAAAGIRHLVLPRLLLRAGDRDRLLATIEPESALTVELTAPAEERERRLRVRDRAATLAGHLDGLTTLVPPTGLADVGVDTADRDVTDVALAVLALWDAVP